MRFPKNNHNHQWRTCRAAVYGLAAAVLLALSASSVAAQGAPPDMDFTSSGTTHFASAGGAMRGTVVGSIFGRIRNGSVTQFSAAFDPQTDGGTGHVTYFRMDEGGQISARWYTVSGGKKLVITNAPAREWVSGFTPQSVGVATLEITFQNNGPGRAVVKDYRHLYYAGPYTPPTPILGGICDCRPQSPKKLTYTLR